MPYDPYRYVPDLSWVTQSVSTVMAGLAQAGQDIAQYKANEKDVDDAYNKTVDSLKNLAVERLGRTEEDALAFAESKVNKAGNADKKNPEQYVQKLGNLIINYDRYAQAFDEYQTVRRSNPQMATTQPPPRPTFEMDPQAYGVTHQGWYNKHFANTLRNLSNPQPATPGQLQVQGGEVGTGTTAPAPQQAGPMGPVSAPASPIGGPPEPAPAAPAEESTQQAPGAALQVTPQTATPSPTGAPAAAPTPTPQPTGGNIPGLPDTQAQLLAAGVASGNLPAAQAVAKLQSQGLERQQEEDLARMREQGAADRANMQFVQGMANRYVQNFPAGTTVSAADAANLQIPLGPRRETVTRSIQSGSGSGRGISEDIRAEQLINNTRKQIGDSINKMADFNRSGARRRAHLSNIAAYINDLGRLMKRVGTTDEQVQRERDAYISLLKEADPAAAKEVFDILGSSGSGSSDKPKFELVD
jgi:hypothetical protein